MPQKFSLRAGSCGKRWAPKWRNITPGFSRWSRTRTITRSPIGNADGTSSRSDAEQGGWCFIRVAPRPFVLELQAQRDLSDPVATAIAAANRGHHTEAQGGDVGTGICQIGMIGQVG